ncbi:hypothetical protein IGK66_000932 [Enterococcus sp. DIV0188]
MKPAKLSFLDLASIIVGIYYGTENIAFQSVRKA